MLTEIEIRTKIQEFKVSRDELENKMNELNLEERCKGSKIRNAHVWFLEQMSKDQEKIDLLQWVLAEGK